MPQPNCRDISGFSFRLFPTVESVSKTPRDGQLEKSWSRLKRRGLLTVLCVSGAQSIPADDDSLLQLADCLKSVVLGFFWMLFIWFLVSCLLSADFGRSAESGFHHIFSPQRRSRSPQEYLFYPLVYESTFKQVHAEPVCLPSLNILKHRKIFICDNSTIMYCGTQRWCLGCKTVSYKVSYLLAITNVRIVQEMEGYIKSRDRNVEVKIVPRAKLWKAASIMNCPNKIQQTCKHIEQNFKKEKKQHFFLYGSTFRKKSLAAELFLA